MKKYKNIFLNFILPGCIIPALVGFIAGIITLLYKGAAEWLTDRSKEIYSYVNNHLYLIPVFLVGLLGISFLQSRIIKRIPTAKGGGIPTSEGIIRGSINFPPVLTLVATVVLSFISFLIGMPLGSEGPSVAIGTSLGSISSKVYKKNNKAYSKYLMTSGASTAFSVATGAPISGIIFALEEIHRRFSPMIIIVSFSSVVAGSTIAYHLSHYINIDYKLFETGIFDTISMKYIFLLIPLGILIGLIAVGFNHLIKLIQRFQDKKLKKAPSWVKLFISYTVTFIIGIFLIDFIGGGHSLIIKMANREIELGILFLLLGLKLVLIAWISQSGVTGGLFIPILTLGALVGAILAILFKLEEYSGLIIAISMVAFMAASIGCPLSALVFSVEALGCVNNIIFVAVAVFFSYITTKLLNTTHVYDIVLERKLHKDYSHKDFSLIETSLIVDGQSFACGKQVRDILFSANILILSIQRKDKEYGKMDNFGDKFIHEGDVITFRVQTYDIDKTKEELEAFLGIQDNFYYLIIQNE